jgi:hypothetical protein
MIDINILFFLLREVMNVNYLTDLKHAIGSTLSH